mgnify:CR=1 FL=1
MFPIRDHNPSGRTPYVTYALILANVGIFLSYWSLFGQPRLLNQFFDTYALTPALVSQGGALGGFATTMCLRGGRTHQAGNMRLLCSFGDNIEDELGHTLYLAFYIGCGIIAGLTHYLSAPLSQIPTVGASGAIAGVMGGYLLLYPRARVDIFIFLIVFFRILPIPAWILLAAWLAMQIYGGIGSAGSDAGVAYWAHAGGFMAGMLLLVPLWLRRGGSAYWSRTLGHPPHPKARYTTARTRIPHTGRRIS